jgi:hypothetical protein
MCILSTERRPGNASHSFNQSRFGYGPVHELVVETPRTAFVSARQRERARTSEKRGQREASERLTAKVGGREGGTQSGPGGGR